MDDYIRTIFFKYKKSVIPGIGTIAFVSKRSIHEEEKSILIPPSTEISFTEYIDDSELKKLTYLIAHKENISQSKAKEKIALFIENTRSKLETEGEINIKNIGFIGREENGQIHFRKSENLFLLNPEFGLPKVQARFLEKKDLNSESDVSPIIQKRRKKYYASWPVIAISLALIIIIGSGIYFYDRFYTGEQELRPEENVNIETGKKLIDILHDSLETHSATIDSNNVDQFLRPDSSKITHSDSLSFTSSTERSSENQSGAHPKKEKILIVNKPTHRYYLIIASLPNVKKAEDLVNELQKKGYKEAKTILSNNRARISLSDYTQKSEATNEKKKYLKDYPDMWILKY